MIKINIDLNDNINSLTNEKTSREVEVEKINNELNESLESVSTVLKISLQKDGKINVQKLDEANSLESLTYKKQEDKNVDVSQTVKKEEKSEETKTKESKVKKALKSVYRIGEELIDSVARSFLKKKFKLNYSVYNDGKSAIKSIISKDYKKTIKKGTDSILYMIKKIPANIKKIIKNTKNKAIDEAFAWGKE